MDPIARHQRITELFMGVVERPEPERRCWLERMTGGDGPLIAEVEALLAADAGPAVIDEPALGPGHRALLPHDLPSAAGPEPCPPPESIGPFTVRGVLGRGGMATVYLAEQDRPRRRVAVKVLHPGAAGPSELRRFRLEADVLARLDHPGIARVLETGLHTTAAGPLPYLAMELIDGESITRHAERAGLGTRARAELLAKACDAVQHAHQKGVIHRDLKPANILVDRAGRPRVLDFGVARLTDAADSTLRTDVRQIIGTVAYMCPEQAAGGSRDVDTRADIYSLGVILYELLAGRAPFDLSGRMVHEAVRIVRDEEPARLSTVDRLLRGDLDTIVATAMAKDPARRYQTAADLGAELRRYLSDQPITARPPSAVYEIGKFVRRHRVRVVLAGLLFVMFALGALSGVALFARVDEAEAAEASAVRRSRARSELQDEMLRELATGQREGDAGARLAALTKMFRDFDTSVGDPRFGADPGFDSDRHRGIGNIALYDLGLPAMALSHYRKALESSRIAGPERLMATSKLAHFVGHALMELSRPAEAEAAYREAQEIVDSKGWMYSDAMASVLQSLGRAQAAQGKTEAALATLSRSLTMYLRTHPPPSAEAFDLLQQRGDVLMSAGRLDEAEDVFIACLADAARFPDDQAWPKANALRRLVRLALLRGQPAAASALIEPELPALLASRHLPEFDKAQVLIEAGRCAAADGRPAHAETFYRVAIRLTPGPRPPMARTRAAALERLAELISADLGRDEEAQRLRVEAESIRTRATGLIAPDSDWGDNPAGDPPRP